MQPPKCLQNKGYGGTLILVICVLKRVMFMQAELLQNTFKRDIKVTSYIWDENDVHT